MRRVIAALVLGGVVSAGVAQEKPQGPAVVVQVAPPGALVSMEVFSAVEGWVRAWDVEASALPKGLDGMGGVGGCAVTLRLEHRVVGRGVSFETGAAGVVSAARAAMEDAASRTRVVHDATEVEQRRAIAKGMAVSVELAGARTKLDAATFGEVDAVLQPGLHGVAVKVGEKVAGVFPAEMMITNRPPSDAVVAAVSEASGDPTLAVKVDPKGQPGVLAKEGKAAFEKFRVTQVAQGEANGAAAVLFRGGRVVQGRDVTAAAMSAFADRLAEHLVRRVEWDAPELPMAGTLMPFQGRVVQPASTVEKLIVTAALAKHAARPGVKDAEGLAFKAMRMHAAYAGEAARGPVEAAAWVIAGREVGALPKPAGASSEQVAVAPEQRAQIGARLASGFDVDTGWSAEVPEGARGFVAYALVIDASAEGLEDADRAARRARAEKAVASIFEGTPPAKLVGQTPWLGMAELMLAEKEVPAAVALHGVRELVWKHQLTSDDSAGEADDLVGGIVFTSSANPLPTAQSVRPVMLLARMARDRRVTTDEEALRELSKLLSAVRFLRQLAVDEWSGYAAVQPETALWGVRSSLWDQRQPVEATALTLWGVCEVLETVAEMGGRK